MPPAEAQRVEAFVFVVITHFKLILLISSQHGRAVISKISCNFDFFCQITLLTHLTLSISACLRFQS